MTQKKNDASRTSVNISNSCRKAALALAPAFVDGVELSLNLTIAMVDAAVGGNKSAAKWLAKAGIETATASNGTTIVIRKDGSVGAWIV